jgi:hypothetical protein
MPGTARAVAANFMALEESRFRSRASALAGERLQPVIASYARRVDRQTARQRGLAARASAARALVQAGLFDRRALQSAGLRRSAEKRLLDETVQRLESLDSNRELLMHVELLGVRIGVAR